MKESKDSSLLLENKIYTTEEVGSALREKIWSK
jgi:hypothetical protein